MTWLEVLKEFYEHFGKAVDKGECSELTRLEQITLEMFAQWLSNNYKPPTRLRGGNQTGSA